jgi:hypothetical protein
VSAAILTIRRLVVAGKSFQTHCDPEAREQGRKMIQRAKRMARRLGYSLTALGIDA